MAAPAHQGSQKLTQRPTPTANITVAKTHAVLATQPWPRWSITVHDGICRCEFCVTGIALIEAALAIWPASYARSAAN